MANSDKKKLSVIYTGGTIAMVKNIYGVLTVPKDPHEFQHAFPVLFRDYEVRFTPVLNKDSTDMRPEDWKTIIKAIYEEIALDPAGIVVVHGVDTICFSASAASYALGPELKKTVVFTGAQLPADNLFGDASMNLIRSARIATDKNSPKEVMIFFNTAAFRATRAQKKDDKNFDALESPTFPPVTTIKDPLAISPLIKPDKNNNDDKSTILEPMNDFISGIVPIILSPGNPVGLYTNDSFLEQCTGIILLSFGGATIPSDDSTYNFLKFVEKAENFDKPLLIASNYPTETTNYDMYDSGYKAEKKGAIPVSGYVLPALVTKFSWILAYTKYFDDYEIAKKLINNIEESIKNKPQIDKVKNICENIQTILPQINYKDSTKDDTLYDIIKKEMDECDIDDQDRIKKIVRRAIKKEKRAIISYLLNGNYVGETEGKSKEPQFTDPGVSGVLKYLYLKQKKKKVRKQNP